MKQLYILVKGEVKSYSIFEQMSTIYTEKEQLGQLLN